MNKLTQFIDECNAERKKVVWPDKQERINATWVVIVSVIILTIFLYAVDFLLAKGADRILRGPKHQTEMKETPSNDV